MNLILLHPSDLIAKNLVRLKERRYQHIRQVHNAKIGDELRLGMVDGLMGAGTIVALSDHDLELEIQLQHPPPEPLPVTLLLALPRPKMLKRILQSVTALGVKNIYLINSYRVDKSFWNSSLLQGENLREHLLLGLEQAADTILPKIFLRPRFKPFVEDELTEIASFTTAYVAHPGVTTTCPYHQGEPVTLAIGPEGGFIPYEVDKLQSCGFTPVRLGERVLRVETAVSVLLSRFI